MDEDAEILLSERSRFGGDGVVRMGSTLRRPRGPGAAAVEALLTHLESVGFDSSPRFDGIDDLGRQVLTFIDGDVWDWPPWVEDDGEHARTLGRVARLLADLHLATASFEPPSDLACARPLPLPGSTWTHGDPHFGNIVFGSGRPVAFIDWDCAAPADPICDLACLLAISVMTPAVVADNEHRRSAAADAALAAIVQGYGLDDADAVRLPGAASIVLDDTADHWSCTGHNPEAIPFLWSLATWFRTGPLSA